MQALQQAAADGCEICRKLQRALTRTEQPSKATCFEICDENLEFLGAHSRAPYPPRSRLDFTVAQAVPWTRFRALAQAASDSDSTGSQQSHALAKAWFENCLQHHLDCPRAPSAGYYPTRLLKLTTTQAFLVESRTEHPSTPYTTLSHRWGNEKFTILTSETIGYFQSGVDFDDFPATFKDAMEVTRQLGFEYIWIDCFCIIQDPTDWANEAPRMSEVYSNGILNIGAARANGPTDGCFASRGELSLEALPLYVNWRDPKDRQLSLSTLRQRTDKYDFDGWDIGEAPISKRAWVVQERHLCARMLYCGRAQLYWKCRSSGNVNELWPDPQPQPREYAQTEASGPGTFHLDWKEASLVDRRAAAGQLWTAALTEFTECALSVASDKLPAIQGIADRIPELSASPYANGVFAFSLPKSLCWENAYHGSARLQDFRWRAPS